MSDKEIPYWPYCTTCQQPYLFSQAEPFASCDCGISEWGYPRPAPYVLSPIDAADLLQVLSDKLEGRTIEIADDKAALQAKIDALMLEHCPEDMTKEQLDEWARHQAPADARIQQRITEGTKDQMLIRYMKRLEELQGVNLVNDDGGMWAVSGSGFQQVPEEGGFKVPVNIHSYVEPGEWKPSILEALQHFFDQEDAEEAQQANIPYVIYCPGCGKLQGTEICDCDPAQS